LLESSNFLTCIKAGSVALEHDSSVNEAIETLPGTPAAKKPAIVYACSGCSDAGELADRIARQLTREGAAEMSCLAGIGGRVKSLVAKAENAERILAIDGCPLNCTRHTLELAGFKNFEHLELHKLGMKKNSCPVTDERIAAGVSAARKILSGARTISTSTETPELENTI
jgi:uncharacterized metal-binding protein